MMQRRMYTICSMLCCLLLVVALLQGTSHAADASGQGTLLILLDASGSMETNDSAKTALQWVQGLWAMCRSLGVNTEVILFRGEAKVLEKGQDGIPELDQVEYVQNSNHLEAIKKAETLAMKAAVGPCGIVMLSDGSLDLVGRKIGSQESPRTDEEKKAIDDFLEKCKKLGEAGKKLLFIGFGEEKEATEDPYGLEGFGMLRKAAQEDTCMFMRATSFPDEDIMRSILSLLGFSYGEDFDGTIENNVIRLRLDKDCYKCGVCVSKTVEGRISKEDIQVTRVTEAENLDYGVVQYSVTPLSDWLVFICLDQPEAGKYEIELPDQLGNTYSVFFMGYADPEATLRVTLTGKNVQNNVQETDQTEGSVAYTVSSEECTIRLELEDGVIPKEYITEYQCGFYSDPDMKECYDFKTFTPTQAELALLELSRDIVLPTDRCDRFIIQASLSVNGTPLKSNKIHVKLDLCTGEISLKVNESGDIPPLEQAIVASDTSGISYFVMEIQEDGSRNICDEGKYDIDCDQNPAQITFRQAGSYCVRAMDGNEQLGASQLYIVTKGPDPNCVLLIVLAVVAAIVLAAIVTAICRHFKRKN